ncbi:hypothetical protein NOR51B_1677 [Luminiphilus syltensis NOR5-1B]|uniref:Uncharacterized protein n=1 Tax=Luminiphilus syltensis NOR5-1B TaxID=565045 RepID=B8KXK7_9GAMM|nr:hypothetical protein NOR51B_1677 [Luminiphilus syltensis NOR5-1B]
MGFASASPISRHGAWSSANGFQSNDCGTAQALISLTRDEPFFKP